MRTSRRRSAARRVLPWFAGALAVQGGLAAAGLVWARRRDEGDDSTAGIRRARLVGGVQLRPHNPELTRVRLDVVMAGAELDLSALAEPVPGGVDVTVHALMAGAEVRVPPGWRVWNGMTALAGGVDVQVGVSATDDEQGADLRLHGWAVMGGVAVEPAR